MSRARLILNSDIVGAPDSTHRERLVIVRLELVLVSIGRKNTLLALDIGDSQIILSRGRSFASVV